jgi:hypothetical protein
MMLIDRVIINASPLFDLKNDDIGPKSGPKLNIDSTISVTWLGPTPATTPATGVRFSN